MHRTGHINHLTEIHLILSVVTSTLDAPYLINSLGVHTALGFFTFQSRREFVIRHAQEAPRCKRCEGVTADLIKKILFLCFVTSLFNFNTLCYNIYR